MNFTLFYPGEIRSGNKNNARHIDEIRRAISPQMERLYSLEPLTAGGVICEPSGDSEKDKNMCCCFTNVGGRNFSCLVSKWMRTACKLHITYYESEGSLSVANSLVDIDNKTKTLFDALALPLESQIASLDPCKGRTHCLCQDDSLVWEAKIGRLRLLDKNLFNATSFTQIEVEIIPTQLTISNIGFFGVPVF